MAIFYTQVFKNYGIREQGHGFSPIMSEYLWFKLYNFSQRDLPSCDLSLEQVIALLTEENYYLASLVKKLQGKQVIQHGEIYRVNRQCLIDFLTNTHADFADKWGMFSPVIDFNQPIESMIYFRGNRYNLLRINQISEL